TSGAWLLGGASDATVTEIGPVDGTVESDDVVEEIPRHSHLATMGSFAINIAGVGPLHSGGSYSDSLCNEDPVGTISGGHETRRLVDRYKAALACHHVDGRRIYLHDGGERQPTNDELRRDRCGRVLRLHPYVVQSEVGRNRSGSRRPIDVLVI